MNNIWLWVALLPPLMYAISCLIDKMIVHGDDVDNDSWGIIAVGTVFDLIIAVPLGVYCWVTNGYIIPDLKVFVPIFLNGSTYVLAMWLFFQAIKRDDTSRAVAIMQTIPVFGFLLGFYGLGEKLSWNLIMAIFLLVVGGYVVSATKGKVNGRLLRIMLLCSALYAVNDCVVAKYGRDLLDGGGLHLTKEILPVIMADLMGKMFFGMISLFGRKQRISFFLGLRTKSKLVALSSMVYGAGDVVFDIAKILAPLALVQAIGCTQPIFVLLGVIGMSFFYKRFPREEVDGNVYRKVVGVVLMAMGGVLLVI